ncbi:MAG: RagB/SusD family nutrient uptake outer membrane protein [Bacteroidales bacterium]|nr:RagB/SusD family nutrient uptake outer membrane protein [Bacteroidales bacterium]
MKKYILILLCIYAFCLCGCTDEKFLTEEPKSILTLENGYDNSDQLVATLVSAYEKIYDFYFDTGMGSCEFVFKQAGTDIIDGKFSQPHYSNITAQWSTSSSFVKTIWDDYYKIISYSNIVLLKADDVTWKSADEKTRVVAEARFLRGYGYLRLAEIFGAVPIVDQFSEEAKFDFVRDPRADVYSFAIEDLKSAYANLPLKSSNEDYGRANKGAAGFYLSEAYLALGTETNSQEHFNQAATYAKEVIALHPMMTQRFGARLPGVSGSRNGIANALEDGTVCSDLFVSDNVKSPSNTEAIWVAPSAPDYTTYSANGSKGHRTIVLGMTPSIRSRAWAKQYDEGVGAPFKDNISQKYGGVAYPYIHGGQGWAQTPITWFASFDVWDKERNFGEKDGRYEEGVTVRTKFLVINEKHSLFEHYIGWEYFDKSDVNGASSIFPFFYKETPMDQWDWDTVNDVYSGYYTRCVLYRNKYIARTGEAYLLLAEAQLRGGKSGEALTTLNELRSRAGASPATKIDIDVILDERVRELVLEECRWATLLRMKPEEWHNRILDYGTYTANQGDKVFPEVRRWAEFTENSLSFKNWPIPQTYIDLMLNHSDNFKQNEGWK